MGRPKVYLREEQHEYLTYYANKHHVALTDLNAEAVTNYIEECLKPRDQLLSRFNSQRENQKGRVAAVSGPEPVPSPVARPVSVGKRKTAKKSA